VQRFIAHQTGNGGLTDLLRDDYDVPVVKLMRNVLDRVFVPIFASGQHSHIFLVELDVDFGETIHYL